MRLDHLLSKEQAEAETPTLHPKVDCRRNPAEEKEGTKVPRAPVAQRIDCHASILYRLQGLLRQQALPSHLDNCTVKKDEINEKKVNQASCNFIGKMK